MRLPVSSFLAVFIAFIYPGLCDSILPDNVSTSFDISAAEAAEPGQAQAVLAGYIPYNTDDDLEGTLYANRFTSVGLGEDGVRRPQAGQNITSNVNVKTKLAQADECPNPPVLSCSAKADETDSCCVSPHFK